MTFDFLGKRDNSASEQVCVDGVQARAVTTNTKTKIAHIFVCILSPLPFTLSFAFYPLKTTSLEPRSLWYLLLKVVTSILTFT